MKINGQKGDYAYKALISVTRPNKSGSYRIPGEEWELSAGYYFSLEDVISMCGKNIKWPVDEIAPGCLYIPHESELNEKEELDEDSESNLHSS